MTHGDPKNPKKNPHPVKRYEVTATANAPGSWDSVKGVVFFQVINKGCVPKDSFTGGQNVPNISYEFEMTRIENNTWEGYIYRDFLEDEDYFGLGVCHWGITQASPKFTVHGSNFVLGSDLESIKPYIEYFKKSDFLNHSFTDAGYPTIPTDPEVTQHPVDFFPIAVTVKEVAL
jgi:hypothetical protein